ncbi:MAG: FTR1 family protein [Proteobacteria bacterium]|nr:FTR1 family protein [Pseudomonadota bacterium]
MLAAAVIVFREVLEAALVIGIVLAATRGVAGSRTWVGIGIGAGLAGAAIVAVSADQLSMAFAGMGQEVFNASVLGLAVVMLGWHNVWMTRHGREIAQNMSAVGRRVASNERPPSALAIVVGAAVLREGAETVLFLYGILSSGSESAALAAVGGAGGLIAGGIVGYLIYFGLVAMPTRHLFKVTTWLITLLAAGMAAQAIVYLNAAGVVALPMEAVWNTSWLLSESSIPGRLLHTLIGYTDQPSMPQVAIYVATIVTITLLSRAIGQPNQGTPAGT